MTRVTVRGAGPCQMRWLLSDTRYRTEVAGDAVGISRALYANYSHLLRGGSPGPGRAEAARSWHL